MNICSTKKLKQLKICSRQVFNIPLHCAPTYSFTSGHTVHNFQNLSRILPFQTIIFLSISHRDNNCTKIKVFWKDMEIENPNANMNGGVLHRNNVQSVESRVALANDLMYRQSPFNKVTWRAIWSAGSFVYSSSSPSCKYVQCFVVLASATSMRTT